MSITFIKIVALTSMFIDHLGILFFYKISIFRIIGRIAFPIYAFLISNGCEYTKNIYNYFRNLLILAIISEIPYDFMVYGKLSMITQNAAFTLSLGCLSIIIYIQIKDFYVKSIGIISVCILGGLLNIDYGVCGVIIILFMYIFRNNKILLILSFILSNMIIIIGTQSNIQIFSYFALVIIFFYDKSKKVYNRKIKNIFYFFYPTHMIILYFIYKIINTI